MKNKTMIEDKKVKELVKAENARKKAGRTKIRVSERVVIVITTGVLCLLTAFGGVYLVNKLGVNKNLPSSSVIPEQSSVSALPVSSAIPDGQPDISPLVQGSSPSVQGSSSPNISGAEDSVSTPSTDGVSDALPTAPADIPSADGKIDFSSTGTVYVPSVNDIYPNIRFEAPGDNGTHIPAADPSQPPSTASTVSDYSVPNETTSSYPDMPGEAPSSASADNDPLTSGNGDYFLDNIKDLSRPASSNGFNGQNYFD